MIDNHGAARPQHGLAQADVVYEIVCETGITRLLAAFYSRDPERVGPIRSTRTYYLQVAKAYDLPLVHVGGNMDALAMRTPLRTKSVCAITNAGSTFFTDSKRKRPHSTYINSKSLAELASKRGYPALGLPDLPTGDCNFTDADEQAALTISYSRGYRVGWVYQPDEQHYIRQINGQAQQTALNEAIIAHNVIIVEAPVRTVEVPVDGIQSEIKLIGTGKALFLRDGQVAQGSWHKARPESHFTYKLPDGSEFIYAPGTVWIQQVPSLVSSISFE